MLACLVECVVVDDHVSSTTVSRCHPVSPAMTEESNPRPAQASTLRALELLVVFCWGSEARVVPLLPAQFSHVCTGDLEVCESPVT